MKDMDANNEKQEILYQYEEDLRRAEGCIESALRSICSLRGDFPRYELQHMVLDGIQNALRDAWKFYDDPNVEVVH